MKTLLFLCLLVCVVILSTQPGRIDAAKKKVVPKAKDKKAEITKYKKLYADIKTKYRQLSLKQEKVALELQKKWFDFQMKWITPIAKDAKKLKQKAAEAKKIRLEEAKMWNKLNVEELKISTERNRIELELAKLQGKPTGWGMRDDQLEEVDDPKAKKPHAPKKKAAKAKDAKTKNASPKNAKASTGENMNEWSNGWDNENYGNMERYGSYYMGSEMYDDEETL